MLGSDAESEDNTGANQGASVQQLCWEIIDEPVLLAHEPAGTPPEAFRISVRFPPFSVRTTLLLLGPLARNSPVPVSLSEPATEVTVPENETSLTTVLAVIAAMDFA